MLGCYLNQIDEQVVLYYAHIERWGNLEVNSILFEIKIYIQVTSAVTT